MIKNNEEILLEIAMAYEKPVYVYDLQKISSNYNIVSSGLQTPIFYSCKALSNVNILKHLHKLGANIECVSINEIKLAKLAGFKPNQIIFTPNCAHMYEYDEAVNEEVIITIDNLEILEKFGKLYNYPVCIRINPDIECGSIQVGDRNSKFGINLENKSELLDIIFTNNIRVIGLHGHIGTDIDDVCVYGKLFEILSQLAIDIDPTGLEIKFIDLGGGIHANWYDELGEIHKIVSKLQNEFIQNHYNISVCFESGKYIVQNAGYLLCKVNGTKYIESGIHISVVNTGMNHLIRPKLYDAEHEIINLSQIGEYIFGEVHGSICETDCLGAVKSKRSPKVGDYLCICDAGAYGYEMSSNYNMRERPAEVALYKKTYTEIRKAETFDDIIKNMIL